MTVPRLIAVIFIFCCVAVAWAILGTSIVARTAEGHDTLDGRVEALWGTPHLQKAPVVILSTGEEQSQAVGLESSQINVDLQLDNRRKGLLWYATYAVTFDGAYIFRNSLAEPVTATVTFEFPSASAVWDDFEFRVNDVQSTPDGSSGNRLAATVQLAPGEEADITSPTNRAAWTIGCTVSVTGSPR
jgi:hypothetical protein